MAAGSMGSGAARAVGSIAGIPAATATAQINVAIRVTLFIDPFPPAVIYCGRNVLSSRRGGRFKEIYARRPGPWLAHSQGARTWFRIPRPSL